MYPLLWGSNDRAPCQMQHNNPAADPIMQIILEKKTRINNIHEIVMISSNVHLFIDPGWKMKLTF